jgi:hypothetical protein
MSPQIYETVLGGVYVHHLETADKIDEGLQNMKFSARGAVRRANSVVQIVVMVRNLISYGMGDFSVFVKRWNMMAPHGQRLTGKKAMALKLLFEAAPHVLGLHWLAWGGCKRGSGVARDLVGLLLLLLLVACCLLLVAVAAVFEWLLLRM